MSNKPRKTGGGRICLSSRARRSTWCGFSCRPEDAASMQFESNSSKVQTATDPKHHFKISTSTTARTTERTEAMLPLLVGGAGSRRGQTRRCHKFDDEHLDDSKVNAERGLLNFCAPPRKPARQACRDLKIAVTTAPESAVVMSSITDWRSPRRLAADHPWDDPGCGQSERQSRGIGHSVLVIEVQTKLHQGPEAGHLRASK
jgi:hypothetical protein